MQLATLATSPNAAAATIILAAAIYAGIQAVKRLFPNFCGRHALLLNAALAALAILSTMPADQVLTAHTLTLIVSATMTAAGMHSTVKLLTPDGKPADASEPSAEVTE